MQTAKPNMHNLIQFKHTNVIPTNIDHILSNTTQSGAGAMLYVFEVNEAVMEVEMDSHGGLEVTIRQTEWKKKKLPNNFVAQTSECS